MREHEHEPIRGLPEELPEGEFLVWQGDARWQSLARRVFHADLAALYFVAMMIIHGVFLLMDGQGPSAIVQALSWQLPLSLAGVGLLAVAGWLYARSTVYTLTNRRMVLRVGAVTPMMVNLPLENMASAGVRYCSDGTGDVLLTPKEGTRKLFYTLLWPHVRPWRFRPVEPLLRGVENPQSLVNALGRVMAELHVSNNTPRVVTTDNSPDASEDRLDVDAVPSS